MLTWHQAKGPWRPLERARGMAELERSIDQVGLKDAPRIRVRANREDGLTKKQARELAALLLEAADELGGWAR
jgi:hypothetical protein